MDSKRISKKLKNLNYTLGKDIYGWIVISDLTGFEWKFPTLGGVNRFIVDEEKLRERYPFWWGLTKENVVVK